MEVSKNAENLHSPSVKILDNIELATDKTEKQKDGFDISSHTGKEYYQSENFEADLTNFKWNPSSATGTGFDAKKVEKIQSLGEVFQQYYENGELYDPSFFYNGIADMQDIPSLYYGIRGKNYPRGRGITGRPSPWKKSASLVVKRKKDEKSLTEPISDLNSWPTLESAVKQVSLTEEQKKKESIDQTKDENKKEEGQQEPLSPNMDGSRKKGVNWVPFKDIGPPPRQLPNSRGRSPRRRSVDSNTRQSWRGESRGFRRGGRIGPKNFSLGVPPFQYSTMMIEGESLEELLRKQIEYYFSTENLIKDVYLRGQMDSEGWVPVSLLANFNRVKLLTSDLNKIIEVLSISEVVECKDNNFLRCRENWKLWLMPNSSQKKDEDEEEEMKEKKEDKKEEKLQQDTGLSDPQQQLKQENQEERTKQLEKKESIKVTLAWGTEGKKVISSEPVQQAKKPEEKKLEEKIQIQANHSSEKRNHTTNQVKAGNNHKRIEKEPMKHHEKVEKLEEKNKHVKDEEGEWETVTAKRRGSRQYSPKEHSNLR